MSDEPLSPLGYHQTQRDRFQAERDRQDRIAARFSMVQLGLFGLSVVLAGDVETLRVSLSLDGQSRPEALRIGERQERPKGLPADLALTGARASWIERFGFN